MTSHLTPYFPFFQGFYFAITHTLLYFIHRYTHTCMHTYTHTVVIFVFYFILNHKLFKDRHCHSSLYIQYSNWKIENIQKYLLTCIILFLIRTLSQSLSRYRCNIDETFKNIWHIRAKIKTIF